jgi:hypothetical protein
MHVWLITPALRWLNEDAPPLADQVLRDSWAHYLDTSKDTQINTPVVTELLLREARYHIDSKIDLIKGTDTKAAMLVTVFGGGLGVLSILGASDAVMVTAGLHWLLIPALALILFGAAIDLVCLLRGYRYTESMPRIDVYNSQSVLSKSRMQARVATSLIEGYAVYSHQLTALIVRKTRLLRVASVSLVAGVGLLVANAAWAGLHPPPPADCHRSAPGLHCGILHSR